jgi:integrase
MTEENIIAILAKITGDLYQVLGMMQAEYVKKRYPCDVPPFESTENSTTEGADLKILDGSIHKRQDGRYETKLYVNGKQVTTACKREENEAIKIHNEFVRQHRKEMKAVKLQLAAPKHETLKSWLVKWFETYKKEKIHSWRNIERTINKHILPVCPDVKLNNVKELTITEILNKMPSDRIRVDCYKVISPALHSAYTNRLITFDVAAALTRPKCEEGSGRALTNAEVGAMLKAVDGTIYKDILQWYLVLGCRASELFYIQKSDVDVAGGTIFVPGTKNAPSQRYVPIFEKTKELLQGIDLKDGGALIDYATYQSLKSFMKRKKQQHLVHADVKDLRTTFGTRCAEQGISEKLIAKWMGHSKAETTNKYYIKIMDEYERSKADIFKPF